MVKEKEYYKKIKDIYIYIVRGKWNKGKVADLWLTFSDTACYQGIIKRFEFICILSFSLSLFYIPNTLILIFLHLDNVKCRVSLQLISFVKCDGTRLKIANIYIYICVCVCVWRGAHIAHVFIYFSDYFLKYLFFEIILK